VSQTFLEYFGINSTSDLPQPKEVEPITDNVVGEHTENKN
jgi:chromosome segregation and condensation protein ScpB